MDGFCVTGRCVALHNVVCPVCGKESLFSLLLNKKRKPPSIVSLGNIVGVIKKKKYVIFFRVSRRDITILSEDFVTNNIKEDYTINAKQRCVPCYGQWDRPCLKLIALSIWRDTYFSSCNFLVWGVVWVFVNIFVWKKIYVQTSFVANFP